MDVGLDRTPFNGEPGRESGKGIARGESGVGSEFRLGKG